MPPTRTIHKKTKNVSGLQLAKSRSTVIVGGNAYGDCKLKPLWIHTSKNPKAMRGKVEPDKSDLSVFWNSNKKAWMTSEIFENWFIKHFIPQVKRFCQMKGIQFKNCYFWTTVEHTLT